MKFALGCAREHGETPSTFMRLYGRIDSSQSSQHPSDRSDIGTVTSVTPSQKLAPKPTRPALDCRAWQPVSLVGDYRASRSDGSSDAAIRAKPAAATRWSPPLLPRSRSWSTGASPRSRTTRAANATPICRRTRKSASSTVFTPASSLRMGRARAGATDATQKASPTCCDFHTARPYRSMIAISFAAGVMGTSYETGESICMGGPRAPGTACNIGFRVPAAMIRTIRPSRS